MLLITGTFRLPPENLADARPAMARMIAASRSEAGCIGYSYAEDIVDPGLIHVSEAWRDRQALDAHFASEHLKHWRSTWAGLGIGGRNLTLHAVDRSAPI